MVGIEDKIAVELFKPTVGFISALLAPKIEKVKQWSEEKELQGKLETDTLSRVLERYLTKLAHRVAEITSISFPLQKLNISEAYEPLFLETLHQNKQSVYSVENLLNSNNSCSLIIDSAGMGKSTFSKYLVTKILFKSDRIPLLFELRKCNQDLSIIDNLALELDFPGEEFSRELFYELIKLGKFIIILDGFDEVSIDFQESLSNQIYDFSVKGGQNRLLLTSRPQDSIPELIDNLSFKFHAFTSEQAKSLLHRYDKISGLDVGFRLISQIDKVPSRFLDTPLLVSLLYRTFGTNNSIADRICTFYDEIYHALYKGHDLINKNGYCREKKSILDFEEFRRLLRALCYYMSITRKTSFNNWSEAIKYIDKASEIASITPKSSLLFLDDLLVAVPLMQKDGCEYKFLHKTILEFFSAEYIIYKKNSYELLNKLFKSKMVGSFEQVFDFIHDISPTLFNSVITKKYAEKIVNLKNVDWSIASSLTFVKPCKVGLWVKDDYTEYSSDHDDFSPPNDFDNGYFSMISTEITYKGTVYIFAITSADKAIDLHPQAWNALSEPVVKNAIPQGWQVESEEKIFEILGVNEWTFISYELGEKLSNSPIFNSLAQSALNSGRFKKEGGSRVVSKLKANSIIDEINREQSIDMEFDEFLM